MSAKNVPLTDQTDLYLKDPPREVAKPILPKSVAPLGARYFSMKDGISKECCYSGYCTYTKKVNPDCFGAFPCEESLTDDTPCDDGGIASVVADAPVA